jgi:hypothetical protein
VPELSSRRELIRHEVDAREEVEEIDADTDSPRAGFCALRSLEQWGPATRI